MVEVNNAILDAANKTFKVIFNDAYRAAIPLWNKIATEIPSSGREQEYPWLGSNARFREFVGQRVIQSSSVHGFTIRNVTFENTIGIKRDVFEDDLIGVYKTFFQDLAGEAAIHPDILLFTLINSGTTALAFDGVPYFSTGHQGWDKNGKEIQVTNFIDGPGSAWYLLDTARAVKPWIFQKRRDYKLVAKTNLESENVFNFDEFIWGIDARVNVGNGFWPLAVMSKQPLTSDTYEQARTLMQNRRRENGDTMGVMPNTLLVPVTLEGAARRVIKASNITQVSQTFVPGPTAAPVPQTSVIESSNIWIDSAEIIVSNRLDA